MKNFDHILSISSLSSISFGSRIFYPSLYFSYYFFSFPKKKGYYNWGSSILASINYWYLPGLSTTYKSTTLQSGFEWPIYMQTRQPKVLIKNLLPYGLSKRNVILYHCGTRRKEVLIIGHISEDFIDDELLFELFQIKKINILLSL